MLMDLKLTKYKYQSHFYLQIQNCLSRLDLSIEIRFQSIGMIIYWLRFMANFTMWS